MNLRLNSNIDIEGARLNFANNKNIVIENFLEPESAGYLYDFFSKQMPEDWWFTSFRSSTSAFRSLGTALSRSW